MLEVNVYMRLSVNNKIFLNAENAPKINLRLKF